ncbi:MAG: hypothetical protein Q8N56_04220 [bacterium]|nr:hypothetical protein [bacterium]
MSILEIISFSIFLGSFTALAVLFFRKAPLLASLPKTTPVFPKKGFAFSTLLSKTKEKAQTLPWLKNFSFEIFLQKVLSKIRILALKAESKIGSWLESLRKKSSGNHTSSKSSLPQDNYWDNFENKKKK